MGREFLRLLELTALSSLLAIPGTEASALAGEPGAATRAPTLVVRSARLDRGGLTIEFSEALRPVAEVDPSRFRLTFAYANKEQPGAYAYYEYYYGSSKGAPLTVYADVGSGALRGKVQRPTPNKIRIPTGAALSLSEVCGDLASAPASQSQVGLYLHFADDGKTKIESERGAALGVIAPYWLTKNADGVVQGSFPGHPIPVSVTCP